MKRLFTPLMLAWLALSLIVLAGVVLMVKQETEGRNPELEKILTLSSTKERAVELTRLLERVGPLETQEALLRSGLPFTGETHLLVHTIGDFVYNNFGLEGLSLCKDYFLSACHHGFIINALADYGLEGMVEAMRECEKVGPGVAPQCAHAAGHGFVAWHDYNLVKGAEMCDALGERLTDFAYNNCYDGVFMENVWGVHDGAPSDKRWISTTDIYYPCTDPRLSAKHQRGCWTNQATLIYQHYRGDLRKTAEACDAVPNPEHRDICYNNLARQINPLTRGDLGRVFSLCAYTTGEERQRQCAIDNMTAFWSVGDRTLPFEICEAMSGEGQERCFNTLAGMIRYHYGQSPREFRNYCNQMSIRTYREMCLNNI